MKTSLFSWGIKMQATGYARVLSVFVLVLLILFPSTSVYANSRVIVDDLHIVNPRITIHVYDNGTVGIVLTGDLEDGRNETYHEDVELFNNYVRVYAEMFIIQYSENFNEILHIVDRVWFNERSNTVHYERCIKHLNAWKYVQNWTGLITYDEKLDRLIWNYRYQEYWVETDTGLIDVVKTRQDKEILDPSLLGGILYDVIKNMIVGVSNLILVERVSESYTTKYNVSGNVEIVFKGDPREYMELYVKHNSKETMMSKFLARFMDKLLIPNRFSRVFDYGRIEIEFPAIRWYEDVLSDLTNYFLDCGLPSDTPVEIYVEAEKSHTEMSLGKLVGTGNGSREREAFGSGVSNTSASATMVGGNGVGENGGSRTVENTGGVFGIGGVNACDLIVYGVVVGAIALAFAILVTIRKRIDNA